MDIQYRQDIIPATDQIIDLYISAGLNRPVSDPERIATMYAHSNLVVTAWHQQELVGISRALTDFSYCCYLSDLAVSKEYQANGIGTKMIELIRQTIGEQSTLLLLSAAGAMEYYPKVGFTKIENGFIIKRKY